MVEAPEAAIEHAATVEIEADGVVIRLQADTPAERIGAIVRALRAP